LLNLLANLLISSVMISKMPFCSNLRIMGTLNLVRFILLRDLSDKVNGLILSSITLVHKESCFSWVPNGQVIRSSFAEDCFPSNKEKWKLIAFCNHIFPLIVLSAQHCDHRPFKWSRVIANIAALHLCSHAVTH